MESLIQAIEGWQRAIEARDATAAGDFLHDDYALVLVQPSEVVFPRAVWLETLADYVIHSYSIQAQKVDMLADVAAVLSRVYMQATVLGQDRSGLFIISDIWLRRSDGHWLVWRRHSTPLSAGEMPEVA